MAEDNRPAEPPQRINLKDATFAAFLAWLWPGAGHLYQGRTAKGWLLMSCILTTFFFGFFLSDGRAVFASWKPQPVRLYYFCQVWVGLPALPALSEMWRDPHGDKPLFYRKWWSPPRQDGGRADGLSDLMYKHHRNFDFGELYTTVAGLLNLLAIFDAFAGPIDAAGSPPDSQSKGGENKGNENKTGGGRAPRRGRREESEGTSA